MRRLIDKSKFDDLTFRRGNKAIIPVHDANGDLFIPSVDELIAVGWDYYFADLFDDITNLTEEAEFSPHKEFLRFSTDKDKQAFISAYKESVIENSKGDIEITEDIVNKVLGDKIKEAISSKSEIVSTLSLLAEGNKLESVKEVSEIQETELKGELPVKDVTEQKELANFYKQRLGKKVFIRSSYLT